MINGVRVKICGLKTLVDAEAADSIGADFLGFNFYPKSPRFISLGQWEAMSPKLPARKNVAVTVLPTVEEIRAWVDAGMDIIQAHFPLGTDEAIIAAWSQAIGPDRLWIAPRLPEGEPFPSNLLHYAGAVLWDTYVPGEFGGSGKTGDWAGFRRTQEAHPETTWILAGGLKPENVAEAIHTSAARFIDLSSGVEAAPGIKDPGKLQAFADAVRGRS